jgi:hypothetical protein
MQRGTTATQRVLVLANGVVVSGQIASERIVENPEVAERRETGFEEVNRIGTDKSACVNRSQKLLDNEQAFL